MSGAKIQLSAEELLLVQNAEVLLTKNRIIGKVYDLFGVLADHYRAGAAEAGVFDEAVLRNSPKISRGENYKGLPWVMLDYPRYFSRTDICGIRTMFWWGNGFSITLHLKGYYQQFYAGLLASRLDQWKEHFLISVGTEEWQHDAAGENLIPLSDLSREMVQDKFIKEPFIKIYCRMSLSEWNKAEQQLRAMFDTILSILKD